MIKFNNLKNSWQTLAPGTKKFLRRGILFLGLYTVLAYSQPWLSEKLWGLNFVLQDKYQAYIIYPIFAVFWLFSWQKISSLPRWHQPNWISLCYFLLSLVSLFFPLPKLVNLTEQSDSLLAIEHFIIFFFAFLFIFLACFSLQIFNYFFKEILMICGVYVIFIILQVSIYEWWTYFSTIIIKSLQVILPWFSQDVSFAVEKFNVTFNGFSVNIGPVCAGFYSLATFVLLFVLALFFLGAKKKINYGRSALALVFGLLMVFLFNIIRVAVIILVGGLWSEKIALELFHEYLSAIFLMAFFILYLYWIIPRLLLTDKKT